MARPGDSMAMKAVRGRKHLTKKEMADGLSSEIYAADGEITPPPYLSGEALKHFKRKAAYMSAVNKMAKDRKIIDENIYGSIDVEALAKMSVSYQKSLEYLKEEQNANDPKIADNAQRKRLAEDRNYRDYMRLLRLDPASRVSVAGGSGGDGDDDDTADV